MSGLDNKILYENVKIENLECKWINALSWLFLNRFNKENNTLGYYDIKVVL